MTMVRIGLYILIWILLISVAIFAIQNLQTVSLNLLAWQSIPIPLGLLLVTLAGFGATLVTFLQVFAGRNPQPNAKIFTDNPPKVSNQTKRKPASSQTQRSEASPKNPQPMANPSANPNDKTSDDWGKSKDWDNW
jgi:uncharacterized integral membrane protein